MSAFGLCSQEQSDGRSRCPAPQLSRRPGSGRAGGESCTCLGLRMVAAAATGIHGGSGVRRSTLPSRAFERGSELPSEEIK
jgi:hypothetical protein